MLIYWGFTGKSDFKGGGVHENLMCKGGFPKKRDLDSLQIFERGLGKKEGIEFLREMLIPQCTLWNIKVLDQILSSILIK